MGSLATTREPRHGGRPDRNKQTKIRDLKYNTSPFKSIPLEHAVVLVTDDASWANENDLSNQATYMFFV